MSKSLKVWDEDLVNRSIRTREAYRRELRRFLDRFELTPDELFELRKSSLNSPDVRDRQAVERKIRILMGEMKDQGYAANSIQQVSKALKSFFESQGLPLRMKKSDAPLGAVNGQRLALVEHIRTMWDYSSTESKHKNRAVLMFLKDSGVRIGDVAALSVGHWLNAETVEDGGQVFKVFEPFETEKMGVLAYIHVGPEAVEAVEIYLEERRSQGPLGPESPLILDRFGGKLGGDGIGQTIRRMRDNAGLKRVSAHSLRKFHTTMLESGGVPGNWIKKLQGKKINGSMGPYSLPEETGELTDAYIRAYPKLRIFSDPATAEVVETQGDKIRELEAEVNTLKDEVRRAYSDSNRMMVRSVAGDGELQVMSGMVLELASMLGLDEEKLEELKGKFKTIKT